jgi:hypothetical protein
MHPSQAREIVASEQGTRPSLGPSTRARQSSLCSREATLGGGASESASRLGKLTQVRGTITGVGTDGRIAARRGSPLPRGRRRGSSEKEEGRGLRPCEDHGEPGFGCPHVVVQLQKSVGDVWSRISSANALQKERSGSSERGPSSERSSAGETVGESVERKVSSRFDLTANVGRGSERDPG